MPNRQDFLLDKDGDFPLEDYIVNGVVLDTPYGDSDDQHISDLIVYDIGSIKEYPTVGFGLLNYLNKEAGLFNVEKALKQTMREDGYVAQTGSVYPEGKGFIINTTFIEPVY